MSFLESHALTPIISGSAEKGWGGGTTDLIGYRPGYILCPAALRRRLGRGAAMNMKRMPAARQNMDRVAHRVLIIFET